MLLTTAIQRTKLTKWLGFGIKLLLTVLVIFFAWKEIQAEGSIQVLKEYSKSVLTLKSGYGIVFLILSFWNWGAESRKWQLILPTSISFFNSFRSVLIGLGVSAIMPRVAGESIGRLTSHTGNKEEVLSGLILSKILQTSITFFMGILGFLYFFDELSQFIDFDPLYVIIALVLLIILAIVVSKKLIPKKYLSPFLKLNISQLIRLYLWTIIRYSSFVGQAIFVMIILNIKVDVLPMIAGLMVMYGMRLMTISFNVAVDLGIRFSTAIIVLQKLDLIKDVNEIIAVFTIVWLLNIVIPTMIGGVLISAKKWS